MKNAWHAWKQFDIKDNDHAQFWTAQFWITPINGELTDAGDLWPRQVKTYFQTKEFCLKFFLNSNFFAWVLLLSAEFQIKPLATLLYLWY